MKWEASLQEGTKRKITTFVIGVVFSRFRVARTNKALVLAFPEKGVRTQMSLVKHLFSDLKDHSAEL